MPFKPPTRKVHPVLQPRTATTTEGSAMRFRLRDLWRDMWRHRW